MATENSRLPHIDAAVPHTAKMDANELPERYCKHGDGLTIGIRDLCRYPDPGSIYIKQVVAKKHGISERQVLVGNGSDELLKDIVIHYAKSAVAIPEHSYPIFSYLTQAMSVETHYIKVDSDFDLTESCFDEFSQVKPALALFSYPNNPTGTLYKKRRLRELIDTFPSCMFLIDEAYYDFCGDSFLVNAEAPPSNVLVMRTFSKAYGLAGLRLGYVVGEESLIKELGDSQLPYNVTAVSQELFRQISERGQLIAQVDDVLRERESMRAELKELPALRVRESFANFLFVGVDLPLTQDQLSGYLRSERILVKTYSIAGAIFLRVSVGTPEENRRFVSAMRTLCCADRELI